VQGDKENIQGALSLLVRLGQYEHCHGVTWWAILSQNPLTERFDGKG
jgi:hypothetical protein